MPMIQLFIFCFLLVYTNAQNINSTATGDQSFAEMCKFYEGRYEMRSNGIKSMRGDICSFKFPIRHETQESAEQYCAENVPFHIIKTVFNEEHTECVAEATLICEAGWIQMFGRCYKIEKKMMKREDAEKHCAEQKPKSRIAFMHREALPFRIKDYFTGVTRVWWDASIAITEDLIYDVEGGYLLLALDGYRYNLPNVAIARVAPTETAMALCEYTPPMNQAESNYLLKRYGEIYYPTLFTSTSAYVRSASAQQRYESHRFANDYCKRVLKPFLQTSDAQAAVPTAEFLDELTKQRTSEIIRTAVYSRDSKEANRIDLVCGMSNSKNYGMDFDSTNGKTIFKAMKDAEIWRQNEPNEVCDGASWSTSVVLSRGSDDRGLEAMSDAIYAPVYCQTTFEVYKYGDCPEGWIAFVRKSTGQKWCHVFAPFKLSFDDAEKKCAEFGAHLSGFADEAEVDLLNQIFENVTREGKIQMGKDESAWIGAKRRPNCNRAGLMGAQGYSRNETHPCSRLRVFEWVNGVAENPPDFLQRWASKYEPNLATDDEQCVELLKGPQTRWGSITGDKKLNDIPCNQQKFFFCGQEAPVVAVKDT
uniref:C-type lectin domain-containing protein n=1 Tax=Caenorhabditis tropicalis TaxID=1561998 RepID=A0A1I7UYZ0_9PELO